MQSQQNRADTLQWAVRSCLAQDYENMTLLVSNNCSADNTEEMLASFNDLKLHAIDGDPARGGEIGGVGGGGHGFSSEVVVDSNESEPMPTP